MPDFYPSTLYSAGAFAHSRTHIQQRHAAETLKSSYNDIGKDDESTPSAGGLETPSGGELRDYTFLFINKKSYIYTRSAVLFSMSFFLKTIYTISCQRSLFIKDRVSANDFA